MFVGQRVLDGGRRSKRLPHWNCSGGSKRRQTSSEGRVSFGQRHYTVLVTVFINQDHPDTAVSPAKSLPNGFALWATSEGFIHNPKELQMPAISMFYGIVIYMYFFHDERHNSPHIHAKFQSEEAVFSIEDGAILTGTLPIKKARLVQA